MPSSRRSSASCRARCTRTILREGVARAAARAAVELPDRDLLVDGWHTLEAFPDTVAALRELQAQGWKLGILTNCDDDLFESTRPALGVEIDLVVTAEQVRQLQAGARALRALRGAQRGARARTGCTPR